MSICSRTASILGVSGMQERSLHVGFLCSPGEDGPKPGWGTLVGDRINSQHHQHMFCARLDFAVDDEDGGKGLQVSEVGLG